MTLIVTLPPREQPRGGNPAERVGSYTNQHSRGGITETNISQDRGTSVLKARQHTRPADYFVVMEYDPLVAKPSATGFHVRDFTGRSVAPFVPSRPPNRTGGY